MDAYRTPEVRSGQALFILGRRGSVMAVMIADFLAVLLRLALDVIDRGVDRVRHRGLRLLHGLHVVLFADDEDLADVAVLLDIEDDADADDVIEQAVFHAIELRFDQLADVRRDFEIAPHDLGRDYGHSGTSGLTLKNLLAVRG